jgi:hypothetical protein
VQLNALFGLAFASAPPRGLSLAADRNSPAHFAKGTRSAFPWGYRVRPPSTACRQCVSGSLSLPSPGFFSPFPHGTSALSVAGEYLALGGGPPSFPQDSPCPAVLGNPVPEDGRPFAYGAITLCGGPFQTTSAKAPFGNSLAEAGLRPTGPPTPPRQRPCAWTPGRFRLGPVRSPLLRESRLLSFPRGTEMFHFPRFASRAYGFSPG